MKPDFYAKTARITAREGIVGEEIVTRMKDGHEETKNTVKEEGDMVVRNPNGEEYIIDAKTFAKSMKKTLQTRNNTVRKAGRNSLFLSEKILNLRPLGERKCLLNPAAC